MADSRLYRGAYLTQEATLGTGTGGVMASRDTLSFSPECAHGSRERLSRATRHIYHRFIQREINEKSATTHFALRFKDQEFSLHVGVNITPEGNLTRFADSRRRI